MTHRGFRTGLAAAAGLAMTLALPVTPASATPAAAQPAAPDAAAARAADQAAASGLDALKRGPAESFQRVGLTAGGGGLFYGAYQRTYQGLRVVGGDAVVVADGAGRVRGTSAAETAAISVGTQAALDAAKAAATARAQLPTVDSVSTPEKVVLAGASPKLAYEVVVAGRTATAPSNLHVFVDAATGAVLDKRDDVKTFASGAKTPGPAEHGERRRHRQQLLRRQRLHRHDAVRQHVHAARPGPHRHQLRPRGRFRLQRHRQRVGQRHRHGPRNRLRRHALRRRRPSGRCWPTGWAATASTAAAPATRRPVGLTDVNAYWNGSSTHFGHSQDNQRQATSIDVVGHEFGHGIFQFTPGGAGSGNENGGMNESTGDIFGALTEAYANNAKDTPDYEVGEGVNLVGQGPIRYMYQPSKVGDPNCYSSSIPSTEVHAAAGPQNHWFYLLAEGSAPGWRQAGQPDLQQLQRHRPRHPEGRQDLLQRPAEEDLVVEPQGRPQGDPRSRDRASTRAAAPSTTPPRPRGTPSPSPPRPVSPPRAAAAGRTSPSR